MTFRTLLPFLLQVVTSVGKTAITPVLEKDGLRTLALDSTLVVSMSRLIVVAFAGVMLREFWHTGIDGWPDATLGIATVLALPLMNAMSRANPEEVLALMRILLARMGPRERAKVDGPQVD